MSKKQEAMIGTLFTSQLTFIRKERVGRISLFTVFISE